jgi:hypothetical protein
MTLSMRGVRNFRYIDVYVDATQSVDLTLHLLPPISALLALLQMRANHRGLRVFKRLENKLKKPVIIRMRHVNTPCSFNRS